MESNQKITCVCCGRDDYLLMELYGAPNEVRFKVPATFYWEPSVFYETPLCNDCNRSQKFILTDSDGVAHEAMWYFQGHTQNYDEVKSWSGSEAHLDTCGLVVKMGDTFVLRKPYELKKQGETIKKVGYFLMEDILYTGTNEIDVGVWGMERGMIILKHPNLEGVPKGAHLVCMSTMFHARLGYAEPGQTLTMRSGFLEIF